MTASRRARSGRPATSGRVTPKGTTPRPTPGSRHVDAPGRPNQPPRAGDRFLAPRSRNLPPAAAAKRAGRRGGR